MKIALVYDRTNKWGGAERVLLTLHKMFPSAPLFTSIYHPKKASWAKVFPEVFTSFINKIAYLRDKHELVPFLMPLAFESFNFDDFDLVISITSEAAKGIIVKGKTKHLCYLLTPTRYLWSGENIYFQNKLLKKFTGPIISYLKTWDKNASLRPDKIVAISNEVQKRIKKYYGRDSELVHPPLSLSSFSNIKKVKKKYFLVVSRLVKYKKVDLAVEVFNDLGLPLVIVGIGKEEKRLKQLAKSNIRFVGEVSEKKLAKLYSEARALIMPQVEDFGLVALESQSHGTPVIAFKKGGAMETIVDKKTGIFFNRQTSSSLKSAVNIFNKWAQNFKSVDAINQAKKFSEKEFIKNFKKIVNDM